MLHTIYMAAPGTAGAQSWVKSNVIPLVLLVIGVGILMLAGKQNHKAAIGRTGIVLIGLAVIAMSVAWQPISSWLLGLLGIHA